MNILVLCVFKSCLAYWILELSCALYTLYLGSYLLVHFLIAIIMTKSLKQWFHAIDIIVPLTP